MEDEKNGDATSKPDSGPAAVSPVDTLSGQPSIASNPPSGDRKAAHTLHVLLKTIVIFYTIILGVWIGVAWSGKRPLYSSGPNLRRVGQNYSIEITVIPEDRQHLACATPRLYSGLHCGYLRPGKGWPDSATDDKSLLRPYTSVEGEQFLAAGLWSQLDRQRPLPAHRFSVLCSFRVQAAVRDVLVRWNTNAAFAPINRVWFVGSLSDCVVPR